MQSALFHDILKRYWGYDSFRPLQEDIIQSIWEGKDTLGLMPTGGGKSLTFQVPVMGMEGLCLVVTPLISLMKDQVDTLREKGIKAMAVYSGMSRDEIITSLENCIFGDYKFLYVSPERLSSEIFLAKLRAMNICLLVVDESHCISQWGYDFRPSYLHIADVRALLGQVPVLALTATATRAVADDIQGKLRFSRKNVFRTTFYRENLSYVVRTAENKDLALIRILMSVEGTAIVYVRSRQATKEVARSLQQAGIASDFFHAGLPHAQKVSKQNAWRTGECRVIVATNAFGMGIDKPDVRLVIHMDLPNSLEEYFQEAGRAGRDGERSYAIILYAKVDSIKLKKRIPDTFPKKEFIVRVYEALGNFFQIAAGFGLNSVYDFDLHEFCRAFGFPHLQAHHALKILELSGYIEYTEEVDARSRVKFLVFRDELYSIPVASEADELIKAILRNYTGVFTDFVHIDESLLAARLGRSRDEVYHSLVQLSKQRYLSYVPQKKTPFIIYTRPREETSFVSIPRTVYEERKKRFEKQILSMNDYATNRDICRNRILLNYFDEKDPDDCGRCDVCLRKTEGGLTRHEFAKIEGMLLQSLESVSPRRLKHLLDELHGFDEEKVIQVIRFLVDRGKLQLVDDEVSL